jgi:Brp/Blh family beta-carotene 15,15'-monooxygenase
VTGRRSAPASAPAGVRVVAPATPHRSSATVTTVCSVGAALVAVTGTTLLAATSEPAAGGPAVPLGVQAAIAAVGIVAGIPHGAADHVVAVRLGPGPPRGPAATMALVLAGYLVVAGLAAAALLVAPGPSVAVFLLVAAAHFAWGEIAFATERGGRQPLRPAGATAVAAVLGLVVVGLPLASDEGRAALAPLAGGLAAGLGTALAALPGGSVAVSPAGPTVPLAVLVVVGGAALSVASLALRQGLHREAVEVATLLALFLATPPLVAFGVYFGAWHALRHTRRLAELLAPGAGRRGRAVAFLRAAALPSVGALAVLAVLWTLRAHQDVVVTGVALLLALTFPHVVVVAALDLRRNRRPAPRGDLTRN